MNGLGIVELARAYRRGETHPLEVVDGLLARIDTEDERLRAFLHVSADAARAAALEAERRLREEPRASPLLGIPVAHKDILHTVDAPTTAHSRTLAGDQARFDATAVARLRQAGMVSLGKTNLSEFACGSMDLRGMPRNPWREGWYTGGSSGGSAAAVAGGLVTAATGTDTAGSIRVPASFCGLVGLKATRGRVSTHGVVPLSWTTDHVGTLTTSVADAALMLSAMAGYDPEDPRSRDVPVEDWSAHLEDGVDGLRIGVPHQHFFDGLEPAVDAAVRSALGALERAGARLVGIDLPLAGELAGAGSVLMMSEAFTIHASALAERGAAYGRRTRQRIVAGGWYRHADLDAARRVAQAWSTQLRGAFEAVDAIVTPTLPFTAFTLERQMNAPPDTSWGTRHFSMTGHPALTVPCGRDDQGLSIGLQLAARHDDESTLFRLARAVELALPWPRVATTPGGTA